MTTGIHLPRGRRGGRVEGRRRMLGAAAVLAVVATAASPSTALAVPSQNGTRIVATAPTTTAPSATAPVTDVSITVESITPVTPARSQTKQPLDIVLTVSNNTRSDLRSIELRGLRGDPITTQKALTEATSTTAGPGFDLTAEVTTAKPVTITSLPASSSVTVTFATSTDIPRDAGICLCHDAVYPLLFTARADSADAGSDVLGSTVAYLPVSVAAVPKVHVGWLWPLMDRPHRLLSDTEFEDDDLAGEVSTGGRLDHALSVVESLGGTVPLTLVVDPETIDELAVMAAGSYTVRRGNTTVPGTGAAAAGAWLERLHQVLTTQPDLQVEQTPYADPDVQSLTEGGLKYAGQLPAPMADRVSRVLDGATVGTGLAWPSASRVSSATLATLADHGADQVVLDATGVNTGVDASGAQPGAMPVRTGSTTVEALLTTSRLTSLTATAVATGGAAVLPRLLSELTVRVTEDRDAPHAALLVPPRYVDPDVSSAVLAIRASTTSTYTVPASLTQLAAPSAMLSRTGTLRSTGSTSGGLPGDLVDADGEVSTATGILTSLLIPAQKSDGVGSTAARAFLQTLPIARQRLVSSAWRVSNGSTAAVATSYVKRVRGVLSQFQHGVHIIAPTNSTYTLASGKSDLPITVRNELDYPVYVSISVSAVGGLPGLKVSDAGTRTIAAGTRVILRLPTTIDRSGRLEVEANLTTPNGASLGRPVQLTVRSTSLGTIGIVIMVVAGALLIAALARRWYRSARHGRSRKPVTTVVGDGS